MIQQCDGTSLRDCRDHALLLIGFMGALRRSELSALCIEDVTFANEGLVLVIRRSKTDQIGEGEPVGIPYGSDPTTCAVRVLKRWITIADVSGGPIFCAITRHGHVLRHPLTGDSIARLVQRRAAAAGLDPRNYGAHSLRAGFATEAAANSIAESDIMRQTRHRSAAVMRCYVRYGSIWLNNPCSRLGL